MTPKEAAELVAKIGPGRRVTVKFAESTPRNVVGQLQAMVGEQNIKRDKELDELLHHIIWDGWDKACPSRVVKFTVGDRFDAKHFVAHVIRHLTSLKVASK